MNLIEFCERYHISRVKARRMNKDGVLRLNESPPDPVTLIRQCLARGHDLTAEQAVYLIEQPDVVAALGTYSDRVSAQLALLGDMKPAPAIIAAYVTDAARNDREAVTALVDWIKGVLPTRPVSHTYLAARLLIALAPNVRQYDVPRLPRALLNCRKSPDLAGWWRLETRKNRTATIYQKPLDL